MSQRSVPLLHIRMRKALVQHLYYDVNQIALLDGICHPISADDFARWDTLSMRMQIAFRVGAYLAAQFVTR
jgi:hypothetical protein